MEKNRSIAHKEKCFVTKPPARQDIAPETGSVKKYKEMISDLLPLDGTNGQKYLESLNIPLDIAKKYQCKYAPNWGDIGEAVVFPMKDQFEMNIAAWGISLERDEFRIYGSNSEGVFYTSGVFDADPVTITGSPIDVICFDMQETPALALCVTSGIPCWLKKQLAKSQRDGMSRFVFLSFKGDAAGDAASEKTKEELYLVNCIRSRPDEGKNWYEILTLNSITHGPENLYQMS